MQKINDQTLEV